MALELLGFAYAFLCAIFFGIYMVPRKYSKLGNYDFLLSMGLGVIVTTSLIGWLGGGRVRLGISNILLCYLSGLLWASATWAYISGVSLTGLARATPIKNTTGVIGCIFGIVFFKEYSLGHWLALLSVLLGSVLVVVSAILLARTEEESEESLSNVGHLGIIFPVYAAFGYAFYSIPAKVVLNRGVSMFNFTGFMGQGCLLSIILGYLLMKKSFRGWLQGSFRDHFCAFLAGVLWSVAVALMVEGIRYIGLAVVWSLAQLNTLVAVLYGVAIFREIDLRRFRHKLVWGLVAATFGVLFLALSRI